MVLILQVLPSRTTCCVSINLTTWKLGASQGADGSATNKDPSLTSLDRSFPRLVFIGPILTSKPSMHGHGQIFICLQGRHRLTINLLCRTIIGIEMLVHGVLIGFVVHTNAARRQCRIPANLQLEIWVSWLENSQTVACRADVLLSTLTDGQPCQLLRNYFISLGEILCNKQKFKKPKVTAFIQGLNGVKELLHNCHLALILIHSSGWEQWRATSQPSSKMSAALWMS